jgi:hypothetical protein
MVDQSNIAQVVRLNEEYGNIVRAVANLDAGARILTMVVGAPENDQMQQPAVVQTQYMTFPAQMVEGIKAQARTRVNEIRSELAELGVTGLSPDPAFRGARATHAPPQPQPAAQPRMRERVR